MTDHLPDDSIEVARIAGAWGVKGSIRVISYSSEADALFHAKQWYLLPPEAKFSPARSSEKRELPRVLNVKSVREQGKSIRAEVQEIADREVAEAFKGMRIFVRKADFPKLSEDEFYWVDLIGLRVINLQDEELGIVEDLMSNGPQSILRIIYEKHSEKAERLIPFVDAFIHDVDLDQKVILVDWQLDY